MHRIVHTVNSEYYLIDDKCVAVRGKLESHWSEAHSAVGALLVGSIKMQGAYELMMGKIAVEGRVLFSNDVMTSPVRSVEIAPPHS
jgi:hypothetical protein